NLLVSVEAAVSAASIWISYAARGSLQPGLSPVAECSIEKTIQRWCGLTFLAASSNKRTPDARQISQASFLRRSGGNSRPVLHPDFLDPWLRRSLFDAGSLRDETSAAQRKIGDYADGRVRRFQLRPAPVRRLSRWPLSFESQSVRRRHGAAGLRLRMYRYRHARDVLRRPCFLSYRQRPQRHLHQHDAYAALRSGGSAARGRFPLEL